MRIRQEEGKLVGYLGGYIKWKPFVFPYTANPSWGVDTMGTYHALKKMADAAPDASGQNQEISTTFRLEAVPAYLTDADGKVLAKPERASPLGGRVITLSALPPQSRDRK